MSGPTCPRCRRVQYYTCGRETCTCFTSLPKGKKHQVHLDHDGVACPYCGFAAHHDYWEERSMRQEEVVE